VSARRHRNTRMVEAAPQGLTLREDNAALSATVSLLQESLADLQLAMEDRGWTRLIAAGQQEFARDGLTRISAAARVYTIKNPLLRRGLALRTAYVWGAGVQITAKATGKNRENPGEQNVNEVVQAFLTDSGNRRALADASAQMRNERALFTDGNQFFSLWTRPSSGAVSVRVLPFDEIHDVVCNPQDSSEPWFYKRVFTADALDYSTGLQQPQSKTVYYPALGYRPTGSDRPRTIGGHPVQWDAPVRQVKVNDEQGWKFGVGDGYPALDWARAYKEFLEAWAQLVKALSRFAWKMTAKPSTRAQAKAKLGAPPPINPVTGQPNDVGATAIIPPEMLLEAIPKSGATIDSESGRPLAMMVAAALDIPVTMLLGDPGLTGSRATAETLDRPTELVMQQRREVWGEALRDILTHVITEAVRAPKGPLRGSVRPDPDGRGEIVELVGDTATTVDINWPSLDEVNPAALIQAIKLASDTETVPPDIILRWILTALGERNVDEIIDKVVDDEGRFLWPQGPGSADTDSPADLARAGADPAATGSGSMRPDPEGDGDPDEDDFAESLTVPNVLLDLNEARNDKDLRAYWVHGKGAAAIRWGQPHDFDRCVRALKPHVSDPEGLCNVYHRAALGVAPGQE
jgi:hypothetical protein